MHSFSFWRNSGLLNSHSKQMYCAFCIFFFHAHWLETRPGSPNPPDCRMNSVWTSYDRGKTASSLNTQNTSMGRGGDQPFKSNVFTMRHIRCYQTSLHHKNKEKFFSFFVIVADKRIPIVCTSYTLISSVYSGVCIHFHLNICYVYFACW